MITKYNNISNLSEWAIILYLDKHPGSKRRDIAKQLNVKGERVGFVIRRLKDKNIIISKQDPNRKVDVLYYLK